jgi:hypothetical protein
MGTFKVTMYVRWLPHKSQTTKSRSKKCAWVVHETWTRDAMNLALAYTTCIGTFPAVVTIAVDAKCAIELLDESAYCIHVKTAFQ